MCLLCGTHRSPSYSHRIKTQISVYFRRKSDVCQSAVACSTFCANLHYLHWSGLSTTMSLIDLHNVLMPTLAYQDFDGNRKLTSVPALMYMCFRKIICRVACSASKGRKTAYFIHDIVGKPLYILYLEIEIYISDSNLIIYANPCETHENRFYLFYFKFVEDVLGTHTHCRWMTELVHIIQSTWCLASQCKLW